MGSPASTFERIRALDERSLQLKVVQPALIGLIDGTLSTLAPIFAAAFLSGSHAALFVGIAAALGAGISMGLSEALSDDGHLTGRGGAVVRGLITGFATFIGGGAPPHPVPPPQPGTGRPGAVSGLPGE